MYLVVMSSRRCSVVGLSGRITVPVTLNSCDVTFEVWQSQYGITV